MTKQSYSKVKGREWETACARYAEDVTKMLVERRRLNGAQDRGDLAGIPDVVFECKAERSYKLPEWMREAERERINDGADLGVVWAKQNGKTDAAEGFIIMRPVEFFNLLRVAGYVD